MDLSHKIDLESAIFVDHAEKLRDGVVGTENRRLQLVGKPFQFRKMKSFRDLIEQRFRVHRFGFISCSGSPSSRE